MEPVFSVIAILFFVLYIRERRKNREMESNYNYINSRLLAIANTDDSNYILVPTDMGVVRETAKSINSLLEKFYGRQMDYNRNQKAVLQLFTNISHDLRTPITVLKGYIEMLYLQSRQEELSPVLRTTIEKIYDLGKDVKEISAVLVQNDVGLNGIGRRQNSLENYFFQITETKEAERL